jgi:protein phosphatase
VNSASEPEGSSFFSSDVFPPLSATVQIAFGARSRCGPRHALNEDHYLIVRLSRGQETIATSLGQDLITPRYGEYGYGMFVADGLGANGAGEAASRLALETLSHLILHFGKWNLRIDSDIAKEILERAERFYRHVDATLAEESWRAPASGLQTTLTAVFGAGNTLFFAHVGHSRAYLLRRGVLMRLTRDHTVSARAQRLPSGPLVDVNATAVDLKHILTETIGKRGVLGPSIDLEMFQLDDRDVVLVCTNGLTDAISDDVIGEVLASERSPDDRCGALVELAAAAGSQDDVTALVAQYRIAPPPAPPDALVPA